MKLYERTLFIGGAFFFLLFLIAILLFKSSISSLPKEQNPKEQYIAPTEDFLVTRNVTDYDLIPINIPLVTFVDPKRGSTDKEPLVTLVEFSDFLCPFCGEAQETINRVLKAHGDAILHVWKDAPNKDIHKNSFSAHLSARCAQKQQKFWEYHDMLFEKQEELSSSAFSEEILQRIALDIGLDAKIWQACFDEKVEQAKIERGLTEALALGVDATPYFFINDKRLSGAISFEELNTIILRELNK